MSERKRKRLDCPQCGQALHRSHRRLHERVLSLVLCGNQPYEWDLESPLARAVSDAIAASERGGMAAFVETFESALDYTFPEALRTWTLENDPVALDAALLWA